MSARIVTFEDAAKLIKDGDVVAVNSSSGLNTPDRMVKAIGERFDAEGHPRDLTTIHAIATGDMYGILGIDHIAKPGLLKRVIGGSYPSGPSSMPSPRIWSMIIDNQVEAYNYPSGLVFDMLRDTAAKRPGVLTKIGLDTCFDPRRQGGKMNEATKEDLITVVTFNGEEWLHLKNVVPSVGIIRGTTADEDGNISMEHEGGYLGALDVALAVRNSRGIVIAQVKRVTARGSIPPQRVLVPSTMVDYVVVDPDQRQATETLYDPAISGEIRRPLSSFPPVDWGTDKVIARRAAMELRDGYACNLGFGISAVVPRILIEEGLHGRVTWAIEQGAVGGVPLEGFVFGCAANAQAIIPSPYQFTYFQGGGEDCGLLSFMEVDGEGNVNVSRLSAKPHVTSGIGGFIDITSMARKLVFSGYFTAGGLDVRVEDGRIRIAKEGKFAKFVPEVEHVTFSGRRGRQLAQDVTFVTERCVMKLAPRGLVVTEVAPGIDLERDVLAQSRAPLAVAPDVKAMDPRLFLPLPMNLRLPPR